MNNNNLIFDSGEIPQKGSEIINYGDIVNVNKVISDFEKSKLLKVNIL